MGAGARVSYAHISLLYPLPGWSLLWGGSTSFKGKVIPSYRERGIERLGKGRQRSATKVA